MDIPRPPTFPLPTTQGAPSRLSRMATEAVQYPALQNFVTSDIVAVAAEALLIA